MTFFTRLLLEFLVDSHNLRDEVQDLVEIVRFIGGSQVREDSLSLFADFHESVDETGLSLRHDLDLSLLSRGIVQGKEREPNGSPREVLAFLRKGRRRYYYS